MFMGMMQARVGQYFDVLSGLINNTEVTGRDGRAIGLSDGFERVGRAAHAAHDGGCKVVFIGNGGSAGIASHLAIDFSKNGGMRSIAFSDASALTCLGNDYGYEHVFAKQLEFHARPGDLVVTISSSGRSPNIINAVAAARDGGCNVVTFSGFTDDNPLRSSGDVNFFVRSRQYGFVEVAHLSLCHAILDLDMGWQGAI